MTPLSCNSQKRLEHKENQISEPQSQVKILIYRMGMLLTSETLGRMGTSFGCSDFWDFLGRQALVMIGRGNH